MSVAKSMFVQLSKKVVYDFKYNLYLILIKIKALSFKISLLQNIFQFDKKSFNTNLFWTIGEKSNK